MLKDSCGGVPDYPVAVLRAVTLLTEVVTEGNFYQENINCMLNTGHGMDVSMAKTENREQYFIFGNKLFCVCFC